MPLSIISLFLFKHTLQTSRLRQMIPSVISSKHPSAGGQLLKPIQALSWSGPSARWGPLAGAQEQPTCPWLLTQACGFRNEHNYVVIFFWWHLCSELMWEFGRCLCSSLSTMTCFCASAQPPMRRVPGQVSHTVPGERGYPCSSLLGHWPLTALPLSPRGRSVWRPIGAQWEVSPMCLTALVPWDHHGFPVFCLPRLQPLDNFHPKCMSHFLPVKAKYLH